jgi:hypothetical protein
MCDLFGPLEEYADLSILTVVIPCFIVFHGCMIEFSSEFVCLPFIVHDMSIMIWIL